MCSSCLPIKELSILIIFDIYRFTRAEKELQAARPFGYGPRKFYESSQLVKGKVDDPAKDKKDKAPELGSAPPAMTPEEKEANKNLRKLYIAMTSDRGE